MPARNTGGRTFTDPQEAIEALFGDQGGPVADYEGAEENEPDGEDMPSPKQQTQRPPTQGGSGTSPRPPKEGPAGKPRLPAGFVLVAVGLCRLDDVVEAFRGK